MHIRNNGKGGKGLYMISADAIRVPIVSWLLFESVGNPEFGLYSHSYFENQGS